MEQLLKGKYDEIKDSREYTRAILATLSFFNFIEISKDPHVRFGLKYIGTIMVGAVYNNKYVGTYANMLHKDNKAPSDRWIANKFYDLDPEKVLASFNRIIKKQVKQLKKSKIIPKGKCEGAIDLTLNSRHALKTACTLIRGRAKNGTTRFEAFATICVVNSKANITLGALLVKDMKDQAEYIHQLLTRAARLGVNFGTIMVDRGFYSVKCMRVFDKHGIGFVMPAVWSKKLQKRIEEVKNGKMPSVSKWIINGPDGEYRCWLIVMKDKRKSKKKSKEESNKKSKKGSKTSKKGSDDQKKESETEYIAFVSNRKHVRLVQDYKKRWAIENRYKGIKEYRARTRIEEDGARMLCWLFSEIVHNCWQILRAEIDVEGIRKNAPTKQDFLRTVCKLFESRIPLRPKPPPKPV